MLLTCQSKCLYACYTFRLMGLEEKSHVGKRFLENLIMLHFTKKQRLNNSLQHSENAVLNMT